MAGGTGRKLFTAEVKRLKALCEDSKTSSSDLGTQQILEAISELSSEVKELKKMVLLCSSPASPVPAPAPVVPVENPKIKESEMLAEEAALMHDCIVRMKQEIAALHVPVSAQERFGAVTGELDAIVCATETATESILSAAEKIDALSEIIENRSMEPDVQEVVSDLKAAVIEIFEASNFQDITGQRITKVVNALQFIEERVHRMVEIWDDGTLSESCLVVEELDEDQKLLNGPQLGGGGISQDEIDKLFG